MRYCFFLLGAVTALAGAVAWMPRPAWIELLDHVNDAEGFTVHDWTTGHGDPWEVAAKGFVPFELVMAADRQDGYLNRPRLELADGRPIFSLEPDGIAHICLDEPKPTGGMFERAHISYAISLTKEARNRMDGALVPLLRHGDAVPLVVSFPPYETAVFSFTGAEVYGTTVAADDQYDFVLSFHEPYLQDGVVRIAELYAGKQVGDCI